jgi:hypothetical protein
VDNTLHPAASRLVVAGVSRITVFVLGRRTIFIQAARILYAGLDAKVQAVRGLPRIGNATVSWLGCCAHDVVSIASKLKWIFSSNYANADSSVIAGRGAIFFCL